MPEEKKVKLPDAKNKGAALIAKHIDTVLDILPVGVSHQQYATGLVVAANEFSDADQVRDVSMLMCAFNAARIGLCPGSVLGLCYFVRRKSNCCLEIGYQGYQELAFRNDFLRSLYADVVFSDECGDHAPVYWGDNMTLVNEHRPRIDRDTSSKNARDQVVGAYCVYETRAGGYGFRFLNRTQLNQRDTKKHVWASDYFEMCRKSPVRSAAKDWRKSPELSMAIALEDKMDAGLPQPLLAGELPVPSENETTISLNSLGEDAPNDWDAAVFSDD